MQEATEKNTLVQLKEMAKELNIKGIGTAKKSELIERINSAIKNLNGKEEKACKNTESDKSENISNEFKEKTEEKPETKTGAEIKEENYESKTNKEYKQYTPREQREQREPSENEIVQEGVLEVMTDGYGFLRTENFLPGAGE